MKQTLIEVDLKLFFCQWIRREPYAVSTDLQDMIFGIEQGSILLRPKPRFDQHTSFKKRVPSSVDDFAARMFILDFFLNVVFYTD